MYARCALVLNVAGGAYPACGNNRAKRSRGGTWNTVWLCRARQLKAIRRKSLLKLAASEEDGLVVLFFDSACKDACGKSASELQPGLVPAVRT